LSRPRAEVVKMLIGIVISCACRPRL